MKPRLGDRVHAGAAADVTTQKRFAPATAAIGKVFALEVHAVESIRRTTEHDAIDLVEPQLARSEGGSYRKPGKLLGRIQGAVHELSHARADDGDSTRHKKDCVNGMTECWSIAAHHSGFLWLQHSNIPFSCIRSLQYSNSPFFIHRGSPLRRWCSARRAKTAPGQFLRVVTGARRLGRAAEAPARRCGRVRSLLTEGPCPRLHQKY